MVAFPRYDQIQQRSVHNAYDKQEQLVDQLLHHRVRNMELDMHRWSQLGCPYTSPPGLEHLPHGRRAGHQRLQAG